MSLLCNTFNAMQIIFKMLQHLKKQEKKEKKVPPDFRAHNVLKPIIRPIGTTKLCKTALTRHRLTNTMHNYQV